MKRPSQRAEGRVAHLLVAPLASPMRHHSQGSPLREFQFCDECPVDPHRLARPRVAEFDLSGPHAYRRETDGDVAPPVVGDGVSNQHVPQFAPPGDVSLSFATAEPASTHQRYG